MIKITRFFYIHILVLPLILVAFLTGSPMTFFITYGVVLIHELCHMLAALFLNVKVYSIILMPFGMTVRLSPALMREPKKEVLVALSGPAANAVMLGFGLALFDKDLPNMNALVFCVINAAILVLNLLPVPPLDGGRVLRAIVIKKAGFLPAMKIMRRISYLFIALLLALGAALLIAFRGNPSLIMIGAFLLYNLADEKKNSDILAMRLLVYEKEKLRRDGMIPAKHLLMHRDTPAKHILKKLNFSTFYIISVLDDDLSIEATVTESDVIRAVTAKGYGISAAHLCAIKTKSDTPVQKATAYPHSLT